MRFRYSAIVLVLLCVFCRAGAGAEILAGGHFAPTYNATPAQPEGPPTALRGRSEWLLYADKAAPVKVKLTCFQVGDYKDDLDFAIHAPAGAVMQKGKAVPGQTSEVAFAPPESGEYKIVCNAGQNASEVEASNARLCIPAGDGQPLPVVGHARKLWFYVPQESEGFRVRICGQGKAETVAVKVWSSVGGEVGAATTVGSDQAQVDVPVQEGQGDSIWSLQLMKAAQGVFEDAQLELSGGVAPVVAERPQDLFLPLVRIELPAIYRRDAGGPLVLKGALLAPTHVMRKPTTFIHMLDPQSGESLYSEMLFRFGRGEYKIRLPQDKVWRGTFITRITLRDDEKIVYTVQQLVRVVNPPKNMDPKGAALVDGKPFFARGLYHVQPADYSLVKQQGFNLVQASPDQIPECERAGLKAAVVLYAGMKIDADYYRENIQKYKGSPAVACWMIMDEPCGHRMAVQKTEEAYGLIRELDPDHPAYMCLCPCRPGVYKDYGESTDIIAIDVYPVGQQPLTEIARCLEMARADAPGQPVWFVGQVWSWPGKPDPKARTLVTPAQHRCMSYLALTHGNVRGLGWYSFRDPDWYLPQNNPEVWAACRRVNDELTALEPVLLEANKWERVVAVGPKGEGEVHLACKVHEDKLCVIAVNPTEKAMPLALDLAEEGPGAEAKVLFENRVVKLNGTTLTDQFEPLAVHVYEIVRH